MACFHDVYPNTHGGLAYQPLKTPASRCENVSLTSPQHHRWCEIKYPYISNEGQLLKERSII